MKLTIALLALVALCAEIRADADCNGWIYGGDTDCTWRDTSYCQTRFGAQSSCRRADCDDGNFSGRATRVCGNRGAAAVAKADDAVEKPAPASEGDEAETTSNADCNGWIYGGDTDCTWRDTSYCQTRFGAQSSCRQADCGDGNFSGRATRVCGNRGAATVAKADDAVEKPTPASEGDEAETTSNADCNGWIYGGDTDCTWRNTAYCQTRFGAQSSCQRKYCGEGNLSGRPSAVCANRGAAVVKTGDDAAKEAPETLSNVACNGWIYGGDTDCTWRDTAYCQTRFGAQSSCRGANCGDGNYSGRPTRVCFNRA